MPQRFRASLSGSGARLGWHVGVLLGYQEDLGWTCDEYRGTSGGGLVAAFAACGRLHWLKEQLTTLTTAQVYATAGLWGLWRGHYYTLDPLRTLFDQRGVWRFRVITPCRLTVYDLQLQAIQHVRLWPGEPLEAYADALLGTMAVPGLFPPTFDGRWVDGGLTEAVPNIESPTTLAQSPWVVSLAMAKALPPLSAPPRSMKAILMTTVDILMAEIVRTNLQWATVTPHRIHALPNPETIASFEFEPVQSLALIAAGRASVQ